MKRRDLIKKVGLAAGTIALNKPMAAMSAVNGHKKQKVLRIAHITDVHIRPEYNAVARFKKCLEMIRKDNVDLILNGGDSIYAADYSDIKKERVLELWSCWKDSVALVKDIPMYSVLGNHDMWWQGKGDELFGKPGVLKMLGLQNNYYSFDKNGWHFIMLDSNHPKTPGMLDDEQWNWFVQDVQSHQDKPTLIMSHYPLLSCTGITDNKPEAIGPFKVEGSYNHLDIMKFIEVFNHNKNIRICLSGHVHLLDKVWYNGVSYLCNGATSGFWWEPGDDGKSSYKQTEPGYSLLNLYNDGSFDDEYIKYETLIK
ncbi:3',5'-cyclic AMP phosphodiesterase CpdA [Mucilaginibacter gossypiicola]|uniref:3',5'-cyclic AMP phosphodiesterase CpdA n=1 Tax=Mucilaginibacter gossypiicola TaxID=551995 RepID=A0A1H8BID9_9SPHI|nr:metallophosphoesterase [Mucilaginibacter gossypiicola]SEM82615.1 3',5'-cyclic AMP phosphodiesterase CpdA [Mucilaginibacter gossypiicola]